MAGERKLWEHYEENIISVDRALVGAPRETEKVPQWTMRHIRCWQREQPLHNAPIVELRKPTTRKTNHSARCIRRGVERGEEQSSRDDALVVMLRERK